MTSQSIPMFNRRRWWQVLSGAGGGPSTITRKLVILHEPSSFEAEQFRVLRHALFDTPEKAAMRAIGVTSALAGDGKTITAINLAAALAAGERVLLVDADLRCGHISELLGCDAAAQPSLVDLILDTSLRLEDAIMTPRDLPRLSLLASASHWSRAHELLLSPRLGSLLAEARDKFSRIVVDTPPLVPVADCRALSAWIDGFVLVVGAHKTPRALVEEAISMIHGEQLIGLVFAGHDIPARRGPNRYYAWPHGTNGHHKS